MNYFLSYSQRLKAVPKKISTWSQRLVQRLTTASFYKKLLKWFALLCLATYFFLGLSIIAARYFVLPQINQFRGHIEQVATRWAGQTVQIGQIEANWSEPHPRFKVKQLKILDTQGRAVLSLAEADAVLSWTSLLAFEPRFSSITLNQLGVVAERRLDGRFYIAGNALDPNKTSSSAQDWLLRQNSVLVHDGWIHWQDERASTKSKSLDISQIEFSLKNQGLQHTVGLRALPVGMAVVPIDVRAHFQHGFLFRPSNQKYWRGTLYADIQKANLVSLEKYISLPKSLSGSQIQNEIPSQMHGEISTRFWLDFSKGHWKELTAHMQGQDIAVRATAGQTPDSLKLKNFSIKMDARPLEQNGFALQFNDGRFISPALPTLEVNALKVDYVSATEQQGQSVVFSGKTLDLGVLSLWSLNLPFPAAWQENLKQWRVQGVLRDFYIAAQQAQTKKKTSVQLFPIAQQLSSYSFKTHFENLSIAGTAGQMSQKKEGQNIWGFQHLSGQIDANERGGKFSLNSKNSSVELPGIFSNPQLSFDSLLTQLNWQFKTIKKKQKLYLSIDKLHFSNADISQGQLAGKYTFDGQGPGEVDFKGQFATAQLAAVSKYLPSVLDKDVRTYFQYALLKGAGKQVTFALAGKLADFPFAKKEGVFRITVPFENASFDPTPQQAHFSPQERWPVFRDIYGKAFFENQSLRLEIDKASLYQARLSNVTGKISDLAHAELDINGRAQGPAQDFIRYINASPLNDWLGKVTEEASAQGQGQLALKLLLPLSGKNKTRLQGTYQFQGNTVRLFQALPAFSKLQGQLKFSEQAFMLDKMSGQFLGGPIYAEGGRLPGDTTNNLHLKFRGSVLADKLHLLSDIEQDEKMIAQYIAGKAAYNASFNIIDKKPEFTIQSNLAGLSVKLPAPFGKPEETNMPARLTWEPLHSSSRPLSTDAESNFAGAKYQLGLLWGPVHMELVQQHIQDKWTVLHGGIGVNQPVPRSSSGIIANIHLPTLDLDAWRSLLSEFQAQEAPKIPPARQKNSETSSPTMPPKSTVALESYIPNQVRLNANIIKAGAREWKNINLVAQRKHLQGQESWQAHIRSDNIQGELNWRLGNNTKSSQIQARFAKLAIPAEIQNTVAQRDKAKEKALTQNLIEVAEKAPEYLPDMDVKVEQLIVNKKTVGEIQLLAHNSLSYTKAPVWTLDKLELKHPSALLTAQGSWSIPRLLTRGSAGIKTTEAQMQRSTSIQFKGDIKDAGVWLSSLGFENTVSGGEGTISGSARWQGSPNAIHYESLSGDVNMLLTKGQLLKVEPGAAKLLGIFSLENLSRILFLDFRSLLGKGLAFEKIQVDANVNKGIAHIKDFSLVSPMATISVQGETNIVSETQKLDVSVHPKINLGSASLAFAVVNPVVGLGSFVTQWFLGREFSKGLVQKYTVGGSWAHPEIKKIEVPAAKETPSLQ